MTAFNGSKEWPNWEHYSNQPMYNTKAVVQQTGVPAPTLRAWERRYALLSPERGNNTYRLYSERDIALIHWLKEHVESGMSISHAVELYHHLCNQQPSPQPSQIIMPEEDRAVQSPPSFDDLLPTDVSTFQVAVNMPDPSTYMPLMPEQNAAIGASDMTMHWEQTGIEHNGQASYPLRYTLRTARDNLIESFQNMDESQATILMGHLFTLYSVEQICTDLITPTLWEVGRLWAVGEATVSVEHFASNFFRGLLMNILHVTPIPAGSPLVITCCAPGEPHELASLMLSLFLRRNGLRVAYLGQSVETTGLMHTIRKVHPAMVCVSLTLPIHMLALEKMSRLIHAMDEPRPLFAFGGQAFRGELASYAERISGIYCDGDLRDTGAKLHKLVMEKSVLVRS